MTTTTVTTQTGTSYTFVLADADTIVDFTNASAVSVTVPPSSSVAWTLGNIISVYAAGAAGVALVAGSGVTIRNNVSALIQYQEVSLRYDGSNVWVRVG